MPLLGLGYPFTRNDPSSSGPANKPGNTTGLRSDPPKYKIEVPVAAKCFRILIALLSPTTSDEDGDEFRVLTSASPVVDGLWWIGVLCWLFIFPRFAIFVSQILGALWV